MSKTIQAGPPFHYSLDALFSIILSLKLGLNCPHECGGESGDLKHWRRKLNTVQYNFPHRPAGSPQGSFSPHCSPPFRTLLSSIPFFPSPWSTSPSTFWEIYLPILREISESQDPLLSPSHSNGTFILIWVIKLMVTPWAGWVSRVAALQQGDYCFSQVPKQGTWQGWETSISSLSQQTEFCCPRAEKLQKPTQVSGQVMP